MSNLKFLFLLTSLFMMGSFSLQAGDPVKGKTAYATCLACHGVNGEGNAMLKAPAIAGQEEWYLKSQIKKFKDGIRGTNPKDIEGMQMRPMAMTLATDEMIDNLAAYVKTLPAKKPALTLGGDANKGKTLYATCMACHGPEGKGNPTLKSPSLVNLPDWYIVSQLKKFKEGIRGTHPKDIEGMQMRPMAMMLADEQSMKDIAAYINSLK